MDKVVTLHEVVDRDAVEIGRLYVNACGALIDSVQFALECGGKLLDKKASMKHGQWLPWLHTNESTLGFGELTAQRFMQFKVAYPSLATDLHTEDCVSAVRKLWGHKADSELIQQSLSNEHYTPAKYVEAARIVLGEIDLDPASCAEANQVVRATRYYSANGTEKEWKGTVWLNPPYGDLVGEFIHKLIVEFEAGNVTAAIALVNAHCTDTAWFQPLWKGVRCFTNHRINFYGDDTRSGSTHGSVFIYLGPDGNLFQDQFEQFGDVSEKRVRK